MNFVTLEEVEKIVAPLKKKINSLEKAIDSMTGAKTAKKPVTKKKK